MFEVLNQYLKQITNQQNVKKANTFIIEAHSNVKRKIRRGDIQINQKQDHIQSNTQKEQPDHSKLIIHQKLNLINERRNQMEKKLQLIQFQEQKLRKQQRSSSVPNIRSHGYYQSKITKHDLYKLKQLMKKQDQYQKLLQQKAQKHEESIKKMQEQQKDLIKKQRQEKFHQRKLQAQKNIQIMKKRQQDRKRQVYEEREKLYRQSQKTIYYYQKMQDQWKKIQEEQIRGRQQVWKILKQKKRVDFDDIRLHQTKYNEIMNQNKQSRLKNSSILHPHKRNFYKSAFLSRVVEQDSKVKESYFEKKNMAKDFAEKKQQYAELVKKNYRPEIKQEPEDQQKNKVSKAKSMSLLELNKKGNQYMKEVNTKVKVINPKKIEKKKDEKVSITYHDYLTERRTNKQSDKNKNYQSEINQIMSKDNISQQQKLYKAKLVAKKLQSSPKNAKNPFKLINSINAKIQILKNVM